MDPLDGYDLLGHPLALPLNRRPFAGSCDACGWMGVEMDHPRCVIHLTEYVQEPIHLTTS